MNHETQPTVPSEDPRIEEINRLIELCIYASPGTVAEIAEKINQLKSGQSTPDTWDTDHNSPPRES